MSGGHIMNPSKQLILKDGQDVTIDVKLCKYNPETKKYDVTFQNGKTYAAGISLLSG